MRRFTILVLALGLLCLARPVLAIDGTGMSIPSFHSDITVNADASISVTETVIVQYDTPHHGIFRNIPYTYSTLDGGNASIPITLTSVTQDGTTAEFSTSTDGSYLNIQIGDPNVTMTGRHIYTITYAAQAATNFFPDHDELYWNVSGTNWNTTLESVSATVTLPAGITSGDQVATNCYTGDVGSTAQDCTQSHTSDAATFSANDFLTVVVSWPTGLVTKPANFDTLRQAGSAAPTNWLAILTPVIVFAVIALVFLSFTLWRWNERRDRRPVVAQYEPPAGATPAEAAKLLRPGGTATLISATIIDLAVRGYLRIEEKESTVFLGLGHTKSYDFVERKAPDAALQEFERQVLDALFRQEDYPAEGGRISLSVFKNHRRQTYAAFEEVDDLVDDRLEARGWKAVKPGWQSLFGAMLTDTGRDAIWHLHGFKLFLKTAERYRLQWQERKNIFEQYLPYAMVFGVAKKWTDTLGLTMTAPPDWYQGDFSGGFNSVVLYTAVQSMSTQMMQSAVSGAASSSSGMSGGSSGGGGGGGGGGGW